MKTFLLFLQLLLNSLAERNDNQKYLCVHRVIQMLLQQSSKQNIRKHAFGS